jgi:hypothetical protein
MINRMSAFDLKKVSMTTRCLTFDLRACRSARIAGLGGQGT